MEIKHLARTCLLACILAFVALLFWEMHWRSIGYPISPDDNKHLWAANRSRLDKLDERDVVLIGSSRIFFDIQLDVWEKETGRRPLQLACPGTTPMPILMDLVNETDYAGTILIGFTPPLYFSPPFAPIDLWQVAAGRTEYFYNRTYADRLNHALSMPLQHQFAFLENDEDIFYNDLDLKTLINRIPLKGRVETMPPFPIFSYLDKNRNVTMWDRVTTDTAYAGMIKRTWQYFITGAPRPDSTQSAEIRQAVLEMSVDLIDRFEARGGQVIFVRCPSSDWFRMIEGLGFPRENYWDVLIERTGVPGYHFEDYAGLNAFTPPEWSHLATPDARVFTRDLVRIMKQDGVLR